MKKFPTFVKALWGVICTLFSFALILLPGVLAFLYWFMIDALGVWPATCGGLGVEFIWLLVITFGMLIREAWHDRQQRKRLDMDE